MPWDTILCAWQQFPLHSPIEGLGCTLTKREEGRISMLQLHLLYSSYPSRLGGSDSKGTSWGFYPSDSGRVEGRPVGCRIL